MNLPNKLTVSRIILVVIFVVFAFPLPAWLTPEGEIFRTIEEIKPIIALIIYIIASLTDAIDGHIARKRNLITSFGKFLDPIADKLLVTAALLALANVNILYLWAAMVILAREFIVSGIRMIAASEGVVIAAGRLGKMKMVFQTIAVIVLLVAGIIPEDWKLSAHSVQEIFYFGGNLVMVLAVILTIISGAEYVVKNKALLKIKTPEKKS